MSQYAKTDELIMQAIMNRKNPIYETGVNREAKRIADLTGREAYRVIDGRLQFLRKAKKIVHHTKATGKGGCAGWFIAGDQS